MSRPIFDLTESRNGSIHHLTAQSSGLDSLLWHADAEHLATVLKPFLSPEGSIIPYKTTNTLIIKGRAPVVNMLSEIIKGKPCTPVSEQPEVETGLQQEETYLDR